MSTSISLDLNLENSIAAGRDVVSLLPALALARFHREGLFGLGEAYVDGLWESDDISKIIYGIFNSNYLCTRRRPWIKLGHLMLRNFLMGPHSLRNSTKIAKEHYDLGNDLFESMLDGTMTYTCGYWNGVGTLQEAQEAKLELICKKLSLRPGMQILDVGCGWGNFAEYAAERFGASVTGVTVSVEQAEFARKRCHGLPVEILLKDYREIQGSFDAVVSIEMVEAVGRRNLPRYFGKIHQLLKPGGNLLLQSISAETFSINSDPQVDQFTLWIMKNIFPDGYLPNIRELTEPARKLFQITSLESIGRHYDPTLTAWAKNFTSNWHQLSPVYGERFGRKWRYYLESCAALFRARKADVYQIQYERKI